MMELNGGGVPSGIAPCKLDPAPCRHVCRKYMPGGRGVGSRGERAAPFAHMHTYICARTHTPSSSDRVKVGRVVV